MNFISLPVNCHESHADGTLRKRSNVSRVSDIAIGGDRYIENVTRRASINRHVIIGGRVMRWFWENLTHNPVDVILKLFGVRNLEYTERSKYSLEKLFIRPPQTREEIFKEII